MSVTAPAQPAADPSTVRYRLTDSTLRDGSHALAHRFTPDQAAAIAGAPPGRGGG